MAAGPDLTELLTSALGPAYRIERELGGGGMSHVFLAEETRLRRRVVIKVLAPELAAALLVDRFEREMRLTAALQDPHIVPVLSAGEVNGLPYYTMPFVEGPSLRARLRAVAGTGHPLRLADAVTILRDVARALAYAHAHGVVHRDIKPENVLLAGDTAVVTDFGIAKALEASAVQPITGTWPTAGRRASATGLTGFGSSLGTPAYMAPEQAIGEEVDARADIYAWGMLAYELLAGVHPFAHRGSVPQIIAAQVAEAPPPLASVAPTVPLALAALVMRCLAKRPDDRPASASELVTALRQWADGATAGEHAGHAARRRRWRRLASGTALGLVMLAAGGWLLTPAELRGTLRTLVTRPAAELHVNRVVVAPFEDETNDPRLAALGSLVADHLTQGLSRLGSLEVVDARTAETTREVVGRIPRFLRPADEPALGRETGAKVVVAGTYHLVGDSVQFRARILDAETGAVRTAFDPVAAPRASPEQGVHALAGRVVAALRAVSDTDAAELGRLSPPPSLAAYAAFREGYQGYLYDRPHAEVLRSLLRAIALDSTYGAPLVVLAFVGSELHRPDLADWALARARQLGDRLTPAEEALLDVTEATAEGSVHAALEAARRTRIPHLVAHPALIARRPREVIATLEATDPDRGLNIPLAETYWEHLVMAHAQLGDYRDALAALREGQRRVPRLREHGYDVSIAAARGDVRAVREALEARWRSRGQGAGGELAGLAARATTLLRTRGGRDAEGRALAVLWAQRLAPPAVLDALPAVPTTELLAAAERWGDVVRVVDAWEAQAARDSADGRVDAHTLDARRYHLRRRHAAALVHVGRRAEALALDSTLSRAGARWDYGQSALVRAVIATQLGQRGRALMLLSLAVDEGALSYYVSGGINRGLGTVDGDPLLLPLRADPRFRALASPDPADRP